ncbi:hypothetical protein GCM10019059_44190 [Camelimonas fluminis]|nr:hypothetical protein GCM10019059_44190 [Camelimonas fluminis]
MYRIFFAVCIIFWIDIFEQFLEDIQNGLSSHNIFSKCATLFIGYIVRVFVNLFG